MDYHANKYYSAYSEETPHGHFHQVIPLHKDPSLNWHEVSKLVPRLCRGWYELAQLSIPDRIEFIREFWLTKLPYHPHLQEFLFKFFSNLDDIGIFLTQQKYEDPFEAQMVYSISGNSGFFCGRSPASDTEIIVLQKEFPDYILPGDYLAFLQIHNGFAKLTDTGIAPTAAMKESYIAFQNMIEKQQEPLMTNQKVPVNPKSLIPFYESFGLPFFQCFWGEWYPVQEMGNVYYSSLTKTICVSAKSDDCIETMAFETFMDWLMFYLEKID